MSSWFPRRYTICVSRFSSIFSTIRMKWVCAFVHPLQHDSDEVGVRLRPLPVSPQLPAVDDVAVQDEFLAADVPEKVVHLGDLGINGSQVDVGYDDGPYAESFHGNCRANPAAERSSAGTIAAQSAGTINLRLRGRTSTSTLALAMWVSPSV